MDEERQRNPDDEHLPGSVSDQNAEEQPSGGEGESGSRPGGTGGGESESGGESKEGSQSTGSPSSAG